MAEQDKPSDVALIDQFVVDFERLRNEIAKVIVGQDFFCKIQIAYGPFAICVMRDGRNSKTRRLTQFNIPGN